MKVIARTRTVNGSFVITLPVEVVKGEKLRENEWVEIEVILKKRDFFGASSGIGHFTKKDRMKGQLE